MSHNPIARLYKPCYFGQNAKLSIKGCFKYKIIFIEIMNFVKIFFSLLMLNPNLVHSFRVGQVKRGGSQPFRAFLLSKQLAHLQKRLRYERTVTVTQRHQLRKNGRIWNKNGLLVRQRNQSDSFKAREKLFKNFHYESFINSLPHSVQ